MSGSGFILRPGNLAPERLRLAGGKAASLARLHDAGFRIPEWFAVLPAAFRESLSPDQRSALDQTASPGEFAAIAAAAACSEELQRELGQAVRALGTEPVVAVRSSATDEDGLHHSFAGQLESYLFVEPAQLAAKVAAVWRSGFSERVLAYRRQQGVPPPTAAPAVLVQRMIDSRTSGVAFSADPVSGRRAAVVISAVPGLGTALVSGAADADTFHVRGGQIVLRSIAQKAIAHRRSTASEEGVEAVPLDAAAAGQPALSDAEALEVAALARAVERFYGRPQDIEWAFDAGGVLWLLQARPITGLAALPDPDGLSQLWDNSNIAESYGGLSSPLTFSFARRAYEGVYHQFCGMMGVPGPVVADNADLFRHMLGYIHGRIYYNLLNWYRVLALLPGFKINRRFMETMMGVRQALPDDVAAQLGAAGAGDRLRDLARLLSTLLGLALNYAALEREIARFYRRLDAALGPGRPDLSGHRPDELVAAYRSLERQLITRWNAPLVNDFFAMIFYGLLRQLCARWCGDAAGTLQNDLLSAQGGMVSAEPAARLREMAAAADPELVALLATGSAREIERALETRPGFAKLYRGYLDKFGDRSMEELKLESATLHEDPLSLLRSVASLAARPAQSLPHQSLAPAAEKRAAEALRGRPLRGLLFRWVLRNARLRVRCRENLRLERTRVFGRVRCLFLELGKRFYALDLLQHPRDIFSLEVEEALGFVEGTATTVDLRALAAVRRAQMERWQTEPPPPDRFETRGAVGQPGSFQRAAAAEDSSADSRKGIGCCPGVVRGPVRCVTDPRNAVLEPGAILVAERTDPGWIMLFPLASGLVVERGSLLSHSAIVARELGLPTVVSLPGAMAWLKDGDTVELDGSTGEVRRIDA